MDRTGFLSRGTRVSRLALAGLLLGAGARAETFEYRVLLAGTDIGAMVVEREGPQIEIEFAYEQNGRGPTFAETLELDGAGYPRDWSITGSTSFGNAVDEFYRYRDGVGAWRDTTGEGRVALPENRFYVEQNGSPYALAVLARALLADDDGRMAVLPGGVARIEQGGTLTLSGEDGPRIVTTYEIHGLATAPAYVTLDEAGEFFASATPRFSVVRAGYEAAGDEVLRAQAERLSTDRFVDIQATAAHDFDGPVRIRNVHVFDARSATRTERRDVVVFGDRIASVEAAGSPVTDGETVIDGEGGTLVPGMYEMHGHLGQENALLNLAAGVTSVRDMGNDTAVLAELIERIESGVIAGPRITRSGFIEGVSPFSAALGRLAATEAEAIDRVRWYAARGYAQVKLYNSMRPDWIPAVVAEAHRLGMRVTGHVPAFSSADAMIEAGFDEITHANQLMLGWVLERGEDTRTLFRFTAMKRFPDLAIDDPAVQGTVTAMLERGIAHDPTIAIHELGLTAVNGEVNALARDIIDHLPVGEQRRYRQALFGTRSQAERDRYVAAFGKIMEILRHLHERGVLLMPGTDLGGSFAYHRELELFAELGMSAGEVLRRATLDMAEHLGQDEDLGSVERGKYADFYLVPGDPTADLGELERIRMVVADGTVYFPEEIYPAFGIEPFASAPPLVSP